MWNFEYAACCQPWPSDHIRALHLECDERVYLGGVVSEAYIKAWLSRLLRGLWGWCGRPILGLVLSDHWLRGSLRWPACFAVRAIGSVLKHILLAKHGLPRFALPTCGTGGYRSVFHCDRLDGNGWKCWKGERRLRIKFSLRDVFVAWALVRRSGCLMLCGWECYAGSWAQYLYLGQRSLMPTIRARVKEETQVQSLVKFSELHL